MDNGLCINEIKKIIDESNGSNINKSYMIFGFLKQSDNPEKTLQWILEYENNEEHEKNFDVPETISEEQKKILDANFYDLVDDWLDRAIILSGKPEVFYKRLWKLINDNCLLESIEEKVYVLNFFNEDSRLPYYELGKGITMEDDEFKNYIDNLMHYVKLSRFIVNTNFSQRTEKASLLLKVLDQIEDEKEKTVIMASIISESELKGIERFINSKMMQEA